MPLNCGVRAVAAKAAQRAACIRHSLGSPGMTSLRESKSCTHTEPLTTSVVPGVARAGTMRSLAAMLAKASPLKSFSASNPFSSSRIARINSNYYHTCISNEVRLSLTASAGPVRLIWGLPVIQIRSRHPRLCRDLVRAAFFAAAERPLAPLVRTALRAAAERDVALRRLAARLACCDSALREPELRGSRFSACLTARETRGRRRVLRRPWPASYAYLALRRVRALAFPFPGGGRSTPARRASERPIAMACCGDLAPCSP
jgi:hypothetical protein